MRKKTNQSIPDRINTFLDSTNTFGQNRAWIEVAKLKLYLRASFRLVQDGSKVLQIPCLDIANVSCKTPGRGIFTEVLGKIEATVKQSNKVHAIYIENVLEQRFRDFFLKRGYEYTGPVDKDRNVSLFKKFI